MQVSHICASVTCMMLALTGASASYAQTADSSIFSKPIQLEATVKTERVARSEQKGDTLIFNAAAYRVADNADSERLISKMPGISVSESGVDANGREVTQILLDGQEFFGNDVMSALRNVPAELVKQIEVINRLSDNARQTGIDDGDGHMAINIVTKRKKGTSVSSGRAYGSFGLSNAASGTDAAGSMDGRYIAGGNFTNFSDKRTISLIGMSNNINKFNFSNSDIVSGSANLDTRDNSQFKVKALSGISEVHSIGANYSSPACDLTYFFNDISNTNSPVSDKHAFTSSPDRTLHTSSRNTNTADNTSHRLDGKITFNPSKRHSFTIRPNFVFEDLGNTRDGYGLLKYIHTGKADEFRRHQRSISSSDRWTLKAGATMSYRYRFTKPKRYLLFAGRYTFYRNSILDKTREYRWNAPDADHTDIESSDYTNIRDKDRLTVQQSGYGKASYTEPLSKRSQLTAEYTFTFNGADGHTLVYPFDNGTGEYPVSPKASISAINKSLFCHNEATLRYNYAYRKISIMARAGWQHTTYTGSAELPYADNISTAFNHPTYQLSANIPFDKSNTLKIEARGRTQNPSSYLLQGIVDRSSTSNVKSGNKTLAPAYLNTASIRYINTDRKAGTTFTFSGEYTISGNYFCDSLVVNNPDFVVMKDDDGKDILLGKDNQFVKPINMGGYHKMLFKTSFAMPVDFLMCNFNIGAQASLQRLPGMINEEKVPIERNWYQLSGRLDSNISKDIDFTVSYSARYTSNQYSGKFGSIDNSFITHRAQAQIRYIMPWEFVFTGGFIYSNTRSIKGLYNDNIYLCDLFIGRRFLENKKLEINIGVNDLFNDSIRSYWHTVSSSGKTDGINSGLGRYFSIQCIWHFGNR